MANRMDDERREYRYRPTYQARALRRDYESGMTPAMLTAKHGLPSKRVKELLESAGTRMRQPLADPPGGKTT